MRLPAWATILFLLAASFAVLAQSTQPKLIDVHEHFNGEPGFLDQLLAKLNSCSSLQKGFRKPANLSASTPIASSASAISSSTIRMLSMQSTAFIRLDFAAWAR